jgi:hypothetical protein
MSSAPSRPFTLNQGYLANITKNRFGGLRALQILNTQDTLIQRNTVDTRWDIGMPNNGSSNNTYADNEIQPITGEAGGFYNVTTNGDPFAVRIFSFGGSGTVIRDNYINLQGGCLGRINPRLQRLDRQQLHRVHRPRVHHDQGAHRVELPSPWELLRLGRCGQRQARIVRLAAFDARVVANSAFGNVSSNMAWDVCELNANGTPNSNVFELVTGTAAGFSGTLNQLGSSSYYLTQPTKVTGVVHYFAESR